MSTSNPDCCRNGPLGVGGLLGVAGSDSARGESVVDGVAERSRPRREHARRARSVGVRGESDPAAASEADDVSADDVSASPRVPMAIRNLRRVRTRVRAASSAARILAEESARRARHDATPRRTRRDQTTNPKRPKRPKRRASPRERARRRRDASRSPRARAPSRDEPDGRRRRPPSPHRLRFRSVVVSSVDSTSATSLQRGEGQPRGLEREDQSTGARGGGGGGGAREGRSRGA